MTARSFGEQLLGLRLVAPEQMAAPVQMGRRAGGSRAHLLVSSVLAKHVPCPPSDAVQAADLLADRVRDTVDDLTGATVVGMAETATGLACQVARALGLPVVTSTRLAAAQDRAVVEFSEVHSHATEHVLSPVDVGLLRRPGAVVLVDDELTTGATLGRLIPILDRLRPGRRHVIAALVDARPDGAQVPGAEVVSLDRIAVVPHDPSDPPVPGPAPAGPDRRGEVTWVSVALDGPVDSRSGQTAEVLADQAVALRAAGARLADDLARHPGSIHVIGLEELMDPAVQLATGLERALPGRVTVSTTTRSPAQVYDVPGYPIRSAVRFPACERGADGDRFCYNLAADDRGVLVVVADRTVDRARLEDGLLVELRRISPHVVVVELDGEVMTDPVPPGQHRPRYGPDFSSYHRRDVEWLLQDMSALGLERDTSTREWQNQRGIAHYAESLPTEYVPSSEYRNLVLQQAEQTARSTALQVGVLAERIRRDHGDRVVLVSLARAGVPVGIWLRRWWSQVHGVDLPHYTVSIVRGRGLDQAALDWVVERSGGHALVFVDGWTGKGAIARELREWFTDRGQPAPELAVLFDPAGSATWSATSEDRLISTACLNATGTGLVSRTVLRDDLVPPGAFHGAKFYAQDAPSDDSAVLLDTVSGRFSEVVDDVAAAVDVVEERRSADQTWERATQMAQTWSVDGVHRVKPGIGETTRALLRRVPHKVLVRDPDAPEIEHIRVLAAQRGVPLEPVPDLPWACVALLATVRLPE